MVFKKSSAQGTVEYLVILAIIVVIGLIVVGMLVSIENSGSITAKNNDLKNRIGTGGISITEAVLGENGDAAITFQNVSGETLTIQSLTNGDVSGTFLLNAPNSKIFTLYLPSLGSECVCERGMKNKSCDFELTKSKNVNNGIISEKVFFTIILDCVGDVNGNNFTYEIDTNDPIVNLISPSSGTIDYDGIISFEFSASDDRNVSSCSLILNEVVVATNAGDENFNYVVVGNNAWNDNNWNVSCKDAQGNIGLATNNYLINVRTFGGGVGTLSEPYEIYNCYQLQDMNNYLDSNFVLSQDINCYNTITWNSDTGFSPIGNSTTRFSGSFNGNNKIISNLFINRTTDNVGLFGFVSGAQIQNIRLVDVNIIGTNYVGGIIGEGLSRPTITNAYVSGVVSGANKIGGFAGSTNSMIITNSHNDSNVSGNSYIGGIVGDLFNSTISGSYNSGTIMGTADHIGGIAGDNEGMSSFGSEYDIITNCYNLGTISGTSYVGGIVGDNTNSTVSKSYNLGNIIGTGNMVGGIAGRVYTGSINSSYNIGLVSGNSQTGGIIGYQLLIGSISNAYWDKDLTGQTYCSNGSDVGCDYTTNNEATYYGSNGLPFDVNLNFDGNWIAQTSGHPILSWQN
jgi:hypothetical protein